MGEVEFIKKGIAMDKIITISLEFGSGGRELGMLIAQRLQIPFYDNLADQFF